MARVLAVAMEWNHGTIYSVPFYFHAVGSFVPVSIAYGSDYLLVCFIQNQLLVFVMYAAADAAVATVVVIAAAAKWNYVIFSAFI